MGTIVFFSINIFFGVFVFVSHTCNSYLYRPKSQSHIQKKNHLYRQEEKTIKINVLFRQFSISHEKKITTPTANIENQTSQVTKVKSVVDNIVIFFFMKEHGQIYHIIYAIRSAQRLYQN